MIGSPAGYFVGGKTYLRCRGCVGLFTARSRRERRVRKHGYKRPLGPSASLCSPRARARRGGGGGGAAGVRSEGRGRRARARRRGVEPPRPRPFPLTDPVAPSARTLASPGDMQMSPAPVPRPKPPTAQWTPPAQTRCLRLCLGRKRNLWPYLLLFPGAAEVDVPGGPPPPIGRARPVSLASGADPPSQGRRPRWPRG